MATNLHAAGLLAPTDRSLEPLRITEHNVNVTVRDQIALTTLSQTFHNDTGQRLEATYVFPLPENADLTDFQMSFNGKMVQGEVLPAEKAREIYESIVRQAKDPGLIEFIGRRLLQMRVFPIEPNSDTKIQVKYQQICRPVSGMSAYHYPLRTAKTTSQVHGTVSFNVRLETTSPLKNVWSPTHSVEVVREGEHTAKVAYEASKGSLEDDFLLLYDTDASDLGMSVIAYKPSESTPGHFVLTLTPKQLWEKQEYQPQDVVFVIDTSGSMAGEKIDQAKAALKFCVEQLDERDRFNLVRFSTGVDLLFDDMQKATKDNRSKARDRIEQFSAAGGTNITDALQKALDLKPSARETASGEDDAEGRPFVVVFVTDGMGNQPAEHTLNMVKTHHASNNARIFTFGVGHDVNTIFLDQLATRYNAKPTYVQPGENLELVLGDFFAIISQPVLTNLKLVLPDIDATERFPTALGDLYHGQQLIVAGKFDMPKTGEVKLIATRNGKEEEYVWEKIAFTHVPEATYVPAIWAGRKISFLIDQIRAHGENKEMIEEVVALSQEHGIQTPYSSWLVNPEQVPALARGGGGSSRLRAAAPASVRHSQQRALEGAGLHVYDMSAPSDDGNDLLTPGSVTMTAGEAATTLAKQNAQMREAKSQDAGGRLNQAQLQARKIANRWYNRIGQFLVDEEVSEQTNIMVVKFGSDAYFELTRQRADLRPALAASRNVVVQVAPNQAILVSDTDGIEQFSEEQLQQAGLKPRK